LQNSRSHLGKTSAVLADYKKSEPLRGIKMPLTRLKLNKKIYTGLDMEAAIFTLGYEGLTIDEFIARLKTVNVKTIVDVRELPLSRKKGFSKKSFCAALADQGVAYLHAPALGCPKPIRDQYKADADWKTYTKDFLAYIKMQDASLRELVKIGQATTACLVCFEADFSMCHRTFVARAARQLGGPVVKHLTAKTVLPDLGYQLAA
jgi:uncharacterized protein (DUF488 family)